MNTLNTILDKLDLFATLQKDWDDDGAEIIESDVINTAKEFLKTLYKQKEPIYHPEVDPCCNGTIDISWHTENQQILINIKKGGKTIGYYGENKENNSVIKNTISFENIHIELLPWLKLIYG